MLGCASVSHTLFPHKGNILLQHTVILLATNMINLIIIIIIALYIHLNAAQSALQNNANKIHKTKSKQGLKHKRIGIHGCKQIN